MPTSSSERLAHSRDRRRLAWRRAAACLGRSPSAPAEGRHTLAYAAQCGSLGVGSGQCSCSSRLSHKAADENVRERLRFGRGRPLRGAQPSSTPDVRATRCRICDPSLRSASVRPLGVCATASRVSGTRARIEGLAGREAAQLSGSFLAGRTRWDVAAHVAGAELCGITMK